MLGMPFVLIAIALALNFIHGGAEGRFKMAKLLVAYEPLAVFFCGFDIGRNRFYEYLGFSFLSGINCCDFSLPTLSGRWLEWQTDYRIFFGIVIICWTFKHIDLPAVLFEFRITSGWHITQFGVFLLLE